jgi:hypothetical protein
MLRQVLVVLPLVAAIGTSPIAQEICLLACGQPTTQDAQHAHHMTTSSDHDVDQAAPGHHDPSPADSHHHLGHLALGCCASVTVSASPECCAQREQSRAINGGSKIDISPQVVTIDDVTVRTSEVVKVRTELAGVCARPPVPLALRMPLRV